MSNGLKECNRVNRINPFGPHIINRGAKGVTQIIRENWVTIFQNSIIKLNFLYPNREKINFFQSNYLTYHVKFEYFN
ncbi:hypothetical protein BpHYR1_047633 [Brachionus plicatilis]|uniref:Uncharacterized protein n=1 Tax=Brachionus plicatilis TaxID=10195 RepID=A0A3M7PGT8_BRAPC|nr:hypothetical protein BpHYR1_047633 [Brachionus plicatilis]